MTRLTEAGVNFPQTDGRRSSVAIAKVICSDAVVKHDPELAARLLAEDDWRHRYPAHFGDLTAVEAQSGATALDVAMAGLESARRQFVCVSAGKDQPVDIALERGPTPAPTTEVVGSGSPSGELVVPYQGRHLRGSELLRQLDDWVARGITEPSFADAIASVVRHPEWLDLSDRWFALFGAGAQMGPFSHLMSWGAGVAVLGIPREQTWNRLAATTRASAGRLLIPAPAGDHDGGTTEPGALGLDLITQPGQLAQWLEEVPGPLTLANYGYLDGAEFVRLSVAFDLLLTEVGRHRSDLSLAYLATPSDVFLVPAAAVAESQRRWSQTTPTMLAARTLHRLSRGRYLRPTYSGASRPEVGQFGLVNAIIPAQGPNYALAKRLQRWRMIIARSTGTLTSVHVAPPTQTASVHSNPAMAERQRLTAHLGLETFEAPTSQAIAAAILVHDLRNPSAPANPEVEVDHPHEAFMFAANPGGRWRAPLDPSSSLPVLEVTDRARHRLQQARARLSSIAGRSQ